ncbi:ABC transporter ATP-binding protein [Nocardioides sp. LHD-245]|uniref:ABC transporter ATP-binding protein n=1 Tax=Nocardioides sp. LHD-245 TaxID=3051387 RepID=UPI0027DFC8D1|nr:ABC transporter ATP-binding protein [Nocardioides sp. LHD-245]
MTTPTGPHPTALIGVASGRATLRELRRILRPRAGLAAAALLMMVVAAAAGIAVPVVIGRVVDEVLAPGADGGSVAVPVVTLVALAALAGVAGLVAELLIARVGEPAVAELREDVLDHALHLEYGVVEDSGTGDLLARVSQDVRALADVVRAVLSRFGGAAITLVLSLVGLAVVDYRFALAALLAVPIQVWATRGYLHLAGPTYRSLSRAEGAEVQQLLESVQASGTVRALGLGDRHRATVRSRALTTRGLRLDAVRMRTVFFQRLNLAEYVGTGAILAVGGWLVARDAVTAGAATAAALMFIRLFNPINIVLALLEDVQSAAAGLGRLVGVLEVPRRTVPPGGVEVADRSVTFKGVGFGYHPDHPVLHDLSLEIAPGERLAVVGASGAGKSTLGALVTGLRLPTDGTVWLGGATTAELAPEVLRHTAALVTQDVHLFRGSLRDDLLLAAPDATDAELAAALDLVGARSWVAALPEGMDTPIGAGGHPLTALQAQEVALARLVLADPPVVVLDEATAEAGSAGARQLEEAIERATAGRTTIVVAHRLSQAARCDRIAVMEDGRLVELGTPEELTAAGGVYARLWAAWARGSAEE